MTAEEFHNLSPFQQEDYLNGGGIVDSTTAKTTVSDAIGVTVVEGQMGVMNLADERPAIESEVNVDLSSETTSVHQYVDGFDIQDPVELLMLLDDDVSSGRVLLHVWQVQFMLDFAAGGIDDKHPFQAVMRACNGSGKDKYIIAACVVWMCMRYRLARGVVTSSSGVQLDNQTCAYIDILCNNANRKWGKIWKINYREYVCIPTESPIVCYATDEAGKAEGFHPLRYGAKMGIFESEAKSVPDEIYVAQNKCTGYTHRCIVSTPGIPMGHFYDLCSSGIDRKAIKSVNEVNAEDYIHYHITAADCPHLSESYCKQMKRDLPGGEFGAAYKSQVNAEFGSTDEQVVISSTQIWNCKKKRDEIPWIREEHNTAGLDLSDGGAETVLTIRNGNKMLKQIPFKFDNTEDTKDFLITAFEENGLTSPHALIHSDCVGIGKPILDSLRRKGWSNIRYLDSRHAAYEPRTYYRLGDEIWFRFGKLVENTEIIILPDDLLIRQLSTRFYKLLEGKHKLLSKPEQKSKGYPSPDRADSWVYCFSDYKSTFVGTLDKDEYKSPVVVEEPAKSVGTFILKAYATGYNNYKGKYKVNNGQKDFSEVESEISDYNKQLIRN